MNPLNIIIAQPWVCNIGLRRVYVQCTLLYREFDSLIHVATGTCIFTSTTFHLFQIQSHVKPIKVKLRIYICANILGTLKDSQTSQPNGCATSGPHPPLEQNRTFANMCLEWLVRLLKVCVTNEPL